MRRPHSSCLVFVLAETKRGSLILDAQWRGKQNHNEDKIRGTAAQEKGDIIL